MESEGGSAIRGPSTRRDWPNLASLHPAYESTSCLRSSRGFPCSLPFAASDLVHRQRHAINRIILAVECFDAGSEKCPSGAGSIGCFRYEMTRLRVGRDRGQRSRGPMYSIVACHFGRQIGIERSEGRVVIFHHVRILSEFWHRINDASVGHKLSNGRLSQRGYEFRAMTMEHGKLTIGPIREISWESLAEGFQSMLNPSWRDIETQIRRLETVRSGSVFLNARNGSVLSIGGEQGKGYLVFISNTEGYKYLQAPQSRRKGVKNLVIGFQPAEYPCRIIVDLDAALKVARMYFDTGRVEENEDWTSDSNSIEQ